MAPQKRMMHLGAFVHETGQHVAAWRHPGAHARTGASFAEMVETAQLAERGKMDFLFLADSAAVSTAGSADQRGRMGKVVKFEPMTILSALAAVTRNLGLVATSTTTYNEPYTLARQFASLDQISGGRSGWNLVTSNNEGDALNYSREQHMAHADRYERAIEFADIVTGLWDSWDEDAFVRDKESGVNFDPAKQHVLDHKGAHFQVKGPLNVPCSPQGRPVVVQAGASGTGRDVAARLAEVVFTAQTTFEQGKEFYAGRARAGGEVRSPAGGRAGDAGLLPGGRNDAGRSAGEIRHPAVADPGAGRHRHPRAHDRRQGTRQAAARRTGAGAAGHQRPAQPPAPAARAGQARQAHAVATLPRQCRSARPCPVDRHAPAGGRRDGALVQGRRG
jgi:alkanesulfonate monooxygenase SsuD/methylene tetrahydromethanopterin reductase-like flavin-dependent oxidoreductase (luciferase family)